MNEAAFSTIDAIAARATDGSLLLSIVHRGTFGPVRLSVEWDGFKPAGRAEVLKLTAEAPWAANTMEKPDAIEPVASQVTLGNGPLELELRPYTLLRVRIPK